MRNLLLLVTLLMVSGLALAQKTVEELGELSDKKFFRDVYYETSIGDDLLMMLNKDYIRFENIPTIEKIGLLSIYIKDDAYRKGRKGGTLYNHDDEENLLSAGILDASKGAIEEVMKANEIEFFESKDYLTDEHKERAYRNFFFNYTAFPEAKRFGEFFERNEDSFATPEDYRMIYASYQGGIPEEIIDRVGELARVMELDAFLTVEIQTKITNRSVVLESISLILHAAHPTLPEHGLFLGIGKYSPRYQVPFAEIKDDEITQSRFDGFEPVINRLLTGLVEIVADEIDSIE